MNGKSVRIVAVAAASVAVGLSACQSSNKPAIQKSPATQAQLQCTTPAQYDRAMGHKQALHDKTGAVVVQLAEISPNKGLGGWKNPTDYDGGNHGQPAAFICATGDYAKLGLVAGSAGNELWLKHSGAGDTEANWSAFMHPVGGTQYTAIPVFKRNPNDDPQAHPPGHAQWVAGDENIWVSCAKGCCYIGVGTGDTTKS